MCLKPLCESTGWGHSFILSHMWRIYKPRITCLQGLIVFQILVWGLPSTSGFALLHKDAKQSWEINKELIRSSKKIQIILTYHHVCGSKITKAVKIINQYTGNEKKHVLKEVIKKLPLFLISFHLGLVLLHINTKSDPHPGMGVWEPRNSYRPTVKWAAHQLFPQTGILTTMCRLNMKIISSELLSYRAGNREMPLSRFEKTSYGRLSISGKIHLLYYLYSTEVEEGKPLELIQT